MNARPKPNEGIVCRSLERAEVRDRWRTLGWGKVYETNTFRVFGGMLRNVMRMLKVRKCGGLVKMKNIHARKFIEIY